MENKNKNQMHKPIELNQDEVMYLLDACSFYLDHCRDQVIKAERFHLTGDTRKWTERVDQQVELNDKLAENLYGRADPGNF